jgi:hypothetical protein
VVTVACCCGQHLFSYDKAGRGRLITCQPDEIRRDWVEIEASARLTCPGCGRVLGTLRPLHGRPDLKLDPRTIQKLRI